MDKKEIKKKLNEMSGEEFTEYAKTLPIGKYFRLQYSYECVMKTLDFIKLINKNKEQLGYPGSKAIVESKTELSPAQFLYDYIMQEISSFYTNAHQHKQEGAILPEIPEYWDILKEFRNIMPGHRDNERNLSTTEDWINVCKKVDDIGTDKIISDFIKYYNDSKGIIED